MVKLPIRRLGSFASLRMITVENFAYFEALPLLAADCAELGRIDISM